MSNRLVIRGARFSYANVFKPRKNSSAKGAAAEEKYSVQIILPKNHPQIADIKAAISAIVNEKWPDKAKRGALKLPLRDADAEAAAADTEAAAHLKGCYFLNASATKDYPPQVVGPDPKVAADPKSWGSGDYGNVSVTFFGFQQPENKGVGVGLGNLQFTKHGERLDGRRDASEEFTVEAEEAGDDF